MKRFFAVLTFFIAVPAVAQEVEVGDTVLAHWAQANAYFVGTAVEEHGTSFLIVFEDGDTAVVSKLKIFKNDITVGSRVIARWKDDGYYPGIVTRIVGRALYIQYDDGDKGWAPWSGVAVSEIQPSTTNTDTALSDSAPVAAAQDGDVTLHGLQLSEGSPESSFMFSALAGELPDGNVSLAPAFEPGVTSYIADVSQPLVTIRARAAAGVNMSVTGTTAGGAELSIVNQSRIGNANDHGAFISVTLSGLAAGENTIQITISVEQTYAIVVTRSVDE